MRKVPLFSSYLILSTLMCLLTSKAFNQETPIMMYPADHFIIQKAVASDSNLFNAYRHYEDLQKQLIEDLRSNPPKQTDTLINGKRIIPVVFHVIHKTGAENISDAQIQDAVERLNIDYNLQNADTADTYHLFKARAADCQIEFRLAKIDPHGNCTDGINRIYDPGTNYAYFHTMTKYAWAPSKYLNIFVVNFIYPEGMTLPDGAFIGGMSPFPPSNPLSQALTGGDTLADGVLIRHDCIGSIGTAQNMGGMPINALNRTFTHETGHYFNLYHTFQNLMLGLIPSASGCHSFFAPGGDEVDDTPQVDVPNQNTSLNCIVPGSVNSCPNDPEPDMVENYMDYQFGYCQNIYTVGQKARINATLMSDRQLLWSHQNLIATGVLDTNTIVCAPKADFYPSRQMICAGSSVQFNDYSYRGTVDNHQWSFPGGTPSTSQDSNPTVTYNTPGAYPVTLLVSNAAGSDSITKQSIIRVYDQSLSTPTPHTESFETISIQDFVIVNDTGSTWQITNNAAYTGSKSLFLNNFDGNVGGSYTEITTPAYDFTNFSVPPLPALRFRLAYAGKISPATMLTPADTAYDHLRVFVSKDCGATWSEKYNRKGPALGTTTPTNTAFTPTSQSQWRQETVIVTGDGGYAGHPNVKFKFVFYSNNGNNIYIDDLFIDYTNASIEDLQDYYKINVYPNPTKNQSNIDFHLHQPEFVRVEMIDLIGKTVLMKDFGTLNSGNHTLSLDLSSISNPGMYFMKIEIGKNSLTQKIIISK
jgi:PKD repeat protein